MTVVTTNTTGGPSELTIPSSSEGRDYRHAAVDEDGPAPGYARHDVARVVTAAVAVSAPTRRSWVVLWSLRNAAVTGALSGPVGSPRSVVSPSPASVEGRGPGGDDHRDDGHDACDGRILSVPFS